MGEAMQRRLGQLVTALTERFPTTPSADVKSLLAELPAPAKAAPKAAKSKGGKTLEELLAAVYEAPDDDTVRQVYADALLEAGDPRGDFMVLQLKRARGEPLSPAEEKQEAALQKKHAKAWLGPLYEVLQSKHLEFRKGFLYSAQIRPVAKAIPPARNHPAWSTVRELNMATGGTNERGASLILQPSARRIRVLTDVVFHVLDELANSDGTGRELEVLELGWLVLNAKEGEYFEKSDRAWKALLTGKAFPRLRELHFGYEAPNEPALLTALWTSPLYRQLELLRFTLRTWEVKATFSFLTSKASRQRRIEADFGSFVVGTVGDGTLAIRSQPHRFEADNVWKELVPNFDPKTWTRVTLAPGALTEGQLALLEKRLPRADITQEK
jgi:uncharacterized protein (TIGR02996 family)